MTAIREAMYLACATEIVDFVPVCRGRVVPTTKQLAGDRDDLLVEARIGCCQKCGCLEATAWVEERHGITYVVARCTDDPSARFLGGRVEPDPGRMP